MRSSDQAKPGVSAMNAIQKVSLSLLASCFLGLAVAGCDQAASPAETQAAVAKAQVAADQAIAKAQQAAADSTAAAQTAANQANDELAHQSAGANQRVSLTEAEAGYKVDVEKCKALTDDQRVACNKQADANVAAARADAAAAAHAADPKP